MPDSTSNTYSPAWFTWFHEGIPAARTELETALVRLCCPLPDFSQVLDVCCGMGRHARALAAHGYEVTGIERDVRALAVARGLAGGPVYLQADIREYAPEAGTCDAVIILSQSFGYFDESTNRDIFLRLSGALRPGGRMILDLWNVDFFRTRQGEHFFEVPQGRVRESKQVQDDRLFTQLDYPDGSHDAFDFQTWSPEQMTDMARAAGLRLIETCTDFNLALPPSPDRPKVQYALERFA